MNSYYVIMKLLLLNRASSGINQNQNECYTKTLVNAVAVGQSASTSNQQPNYDAINRTGYYRSVDYVNRVQGNTPNLQMGDNRVVNTNSTTAYIPSNNGNHSYAGGISNYSKDTSTYNADYSSLRNNCLNQPLNPQIKSEQQINWCNKPPSSTLSKEDFTRSRTNLRQSDFGIPNAYGFRSDFVTSSHRTQPPNLSLATNSHVSTAIMSQLSCSNVYSQPHINRAPCTTTSATYTGCSDESNISTNKHKIRYSYKHMRDKSPIRHVPLPKFQSHPLSEELGTNTRTTHTSENKQTTPHLSHAEHTPYQSTTNPQTNILYNTKAKMESCELYNKRYVMNAYKTSNPTISNPNINITSCSFNANSNSTTNSKPLIKHTNHLHNVSTSFDNYKLQNVDSVNNYPKNVLTNNKSNVTLSNISIKEQPSFHEPTLAIDPSSTTNNYQLYPSNLLPSNNATNFHVNDRPDLISSPCSNPIPKNTITLGNKSRDSNMTKPNDTYYGIYNNAVDGPIEFLNIKLENQKINGDFNYAGKRFVNNSDISNISMVRQKRNDIDSIETNSNIIPRSSTSIYSSSFSLQDLPITQTNYNESNIKNHPNVDASTMMHTTTKDHQQIKQHPAESRKCNCSSNICNNKYPNAYTTNYTYIRPTQYTNTNNLTLGFNQYSQKPNYAPVPRFNQNLPHLQNTVTHHFNQPSQIPNITSAPRFNHILPTSSSKLPCGCYKYPNQSYQTPNMYPLCNQVLPSTNANESNGFNQPSGNTSLTGYYQSIRKPNSIPICNQMLPTVNNTVTLDSNTYSQNTNNSQVLMPGFKQSFPNPHNAPITRFNQNVQSAYNKSLSGFNQSYHTPNTTPSPICNQTLQNTQNILIPEYNQYLQNCSYSSQCSTVSMMPYSSQTSQPRFVQASTSSFTHPYVNNTSSSISDVSRPMSNHNKLSSFPIYSQFHPHSSTISNSTNSQSIPVSHQSTQNYLLSPKSDYFNSTINYEKSNPHSIESITSSNKPIAISTNIKRNQPNSRRRLSFDNISPGNAYLNDSFDRNSTTNFNEKLSRNRLKNLLKLDDISVVNQSKGKLNNFIEKSDELFDKSNKLASETPITKSIREALTSDINKIDKFNISEESQIQNTHDSINTKEFSTRSMIDEILIHEINKTSIDYSLLNNLTNPSTIHNSTVSKTSSNLNEETSNDKIKPIEDQLENQISSTTSPENITNDIDDMQPSIDSIDIKCTKSDDASFIRTSHVNAYATIDLNDYENTKCDINNTPMSISNFYDYSNSPNYVLANISQTPFDECQVKNINSNIESDHETELPTYLESTSQCNQNNPCDYNDKSTTSYSENSPSSCKSSNDDKSINDDYQIEYNHQVTPTKYNISNDTIVNSSTDKLFVKIPKSNFTESSNDNCVTHKIGIGLLAEYDFNGIPGLVKYIYDKKNKTNTQLIDNEPTSNELSIQDNCKVEEMSIKIDDSSDIHTTIISTSNPEVITTNNQIIDKDDDKFIIEDSQNNIQENITNDEIQFKVSVPIDNTLPLVNNNLKRINDITIQYDLSNSPTKKPKYSYLSTEIPPTTNDLLFKFSDKEIRQKISKYGDKCSKKNYYDSPLFNPNNLRMYKINNFTQSKDNIDHSNCQKIYFNFRAIVDQICRESDDDI